MMVVVGAIKKYGKRIHTLVLVLLRLHIQLKMVYRFRSIVVPLGTVAHQLVAVLLFSEASEL